MSKTNAIRILEAANITFSTVDYEFSEEEIDAVSVANKIGAEPESVFKTLVAVDNNGVNCVFVIPGNFELDLKKAAQTVGSKKVELIKVKELLPLTGYVRGGCSPIGMKKQLLTFIDETAILFDEIYVSAGVRGMQILISPGDLKEILSAEFSDLT